LGHLSHSLYTVPTSIDLHQISLAITSKDSRIIGRSNMPLLQPKLSPPSQDLDFTGKVVLITGANAGLGFAATYQILLRHATEVIMAVRTSAKGETAKSQVLTHLAVQSANPTARITVLALDLSDYASVIAFAAEIKRTRHTGCAPPERGHRQPAMGDRVLRPRENDTSEPPVAHAPRV
jgi:3-oxoacyl-ACP reductase-like protein